MFRELRPEGVLRSSNGHDLKITRLRYVPSRGKRYAAVRTDDAEDRTDTDLKAYKLDPLEGEALWFFGGLATVKASAEQTGGGFSISEQVFPKGMATPLHSQPEDDEAFYVLEGDLTFYLEDGQPLAASAGSFVHLPAGTAHAYQVDSETAGVLNITTPNTSASSARPPSRRGSEPSPRKPRPTWTRSWPRRTSTGWRYSAPRPALGAEPGSIRLCSPECVEALFSEVRLYGVLRSSGLLVDDVLAAVHEAVILRSP